MNGNSALLDSNILIAISKKYDRLENYFADYDNVYASIISYIEVIGFDFRVESEKRILKDILGKIEIVNLNFDIADIAIEVRKKSKIKLPDAIIYATSVYMNADLLTRNTDDFKNLT